MTALAHPLSTTQDAQPFPYLASLLITIPSSPDRSSNTTIFGCSSTYLHSMANVVLPSNASLLRTPLTPEEFSATGFQDLLYAKYLAGELAPSATDYPHSLSGLSNSTGVNGTSIDAQSPIPIASYQFGITRLWKHYFVLSMRDFFDITANPKHVYAKRTTDKIIFGVDSRSAIIAEAIFLAASLVLVSLAFIYPRRHHFLQGDPGSIVAQCAILTDVCASIDQITQSDTDFSKLTPRQLRRLGKTMSCRWVDGPAGKRLAILPCEKIGWSPQSRSLLTGKNTRTRRLPRPHFLKPTWFLLECIFLASVLIAFGVSVQ